MLNSFSCRHWQLRWIQSSCRYSYHLSWRALNPTQRARRLLWIGSFVDRYGHLFDSFFIYLLLRFTFFILLAFLLWLLFRVLDLTIFRFGQIVRLYLWNSLIEVEFWFFEVLVQRLLLNCLELDADLADVAGAFVWFYSLFGLTAWAGWHQELAAFIEDWIFSLRWQLTVCLGLQRGICCCHWCSIIIPLCCSMSALLVALLFFILLHKHALQKLLRSQLYWRYWDPSCFHDLGPFRCYGNWLCWNIVQITMLDLLIRFINFLLNRLEILIVWI